MRKYRSPATARDAGDQYSPKLLLHSALDCVTWR